MLVLVDPKDSRAVRNKDNVLALYDLMINCKKSDEGTAKFVSPAYIQHNPLIADGSVALGKFFGQDSTCGGARRRGSGRYIGGFTPSTPTAIVFATSPELVCVALMKTSSPLVTNAFVPGRKVTIGAVGGTSTSSWPPL